MIFHLLLAAAQAAAVSADCSYDREAMLALDNRAFDQDMTGGWRKLAAAGCDLAAADLIRDWGVGHRVDSPVLIWHEGQLRANAGQTAQAIALFERARKPAADDARFGWNLYVDGSIAFLRGDRAKLKAARKRLAALPVPPGYAPVDPSGKPVAFRWPMNLGVLDGFLLCWGRSYKAAYACAVPQPRIMPSATNPPPPPSRG